MRDVKAMALSSMTGFARSHGVAGAYAWAWEIKSVNAKGLDLRFRLPPGWDAVEVPSRMRGTEKLARGTVYANLTVERQGTQPTVKVNEAVLGAVLSTLKGLSGKVDAAPPTLDGILSLKGVIEVTEEDERDEDHRAAEAAIVAGFDQVLAALVAMRQAEGETLGRLLSARLDEIGSLGARAEKAPGRRPEAIKARLAEQVAALLETTERLVSDRLYQEAVLLAAKADIREELDRLASHVAQAKKLLAGGGAIGRKLDFLAQELHRESNTLTAKAGDLELANIGLELKSVVEQFREQVQNLE
jgi:uncharacterized protein (TIGR00255 family)